MRGSLLRYVLVKLTRAGQAGWDPAESGLGIGCWDLVRGSPSYITLPPRQHQHTFLFPRFRHVFRRSAFLSHDPFLLSPPSLPSPPSPPPPLALCPPPPALTLARRVEGVCYFLASPDGASSPHAAKFKSAIQMIVDKVEKMQQPDGYMDIYFTVVDPEGRFQNLRDMHEMCQCSLFLGLCNRWLYLADGT